MIREITNAMAGALYKAFPHVEIYSEHVPQGFFAPCFFIRLISAKQKPQLRNRFIQEYFFDVHYFPKSENKTNEEMNEISLQLYDVLCYISYKEWRFSGKDMHHEQQEEELHFFITFYGFGYRDLEKIPNMEHLTIEERVKQYGKKKR